MFLEDLPDAWIFSKIIEDGAGDFFKGLFDFWFFFWASVKFLTKLAFARQIPMKVGQSVQTTSSALIGRWFNLDL